jgi:1-acyl-sn-glycerol-3-phosphate acyltransferase
MLMRWLGRALLPLLLHIEVTGRERFPSGGPLLVVGNHVGAIEVPLLITYAPWQIEMLGPGDIPPPPAMHAIARLYGYTPINRGNVDRLPLMKVLDVLRQGGVVGLFPEGGIWAPGTQPAKRGVAWLSHRARAPVLPVGFGGLEGALKAALRLRRPRVSMRVGHLIPPTSLLPGRPRRDALQEAADRILQAVRDLVPEGPGARLPTPQQEHFELLIHVSSPSQSNRAYEARHLPHGRALSVLLYQPAVLRIFSRDLGIDVSALQEVDDAHDASEVAAATGRVLHYVRDTNPGFFTYRFGRQDGQAIEAGLRELKELAVLEATRGRRLTITPLHRYRLPDDDREGVETRPAAPHDW